MSNILVVDDEKEIVDLVEIYLRNAGHSIVKHYNPWDVLKGGLEKIELAVLDVMMPEIDGFTLCRKLREIGCTFPIIMLTAKDGDNDKINGLMLGADDYVVKPFNPMELVARVNAQLRRSRDYAGAGSQEADESLIDIRGLVVNEKAHTCTLYGKEVQLTPTEFAILLMLCRNQGRVISSEQIFESVWGEKYLENNNTVMTHMQKLRSKLNDTEKKKKFIQTVWGVGYKIEK